jgi:hypothetical protein
MFVSFISRATRSTELRITGVDLSNEARSFVEDTGSHPIRVISRRPKPNTTSDDLDRIEALVKNYHGLPDHVPIVFLEVERTDASEFNQRLHVEGKRVGNHCILRARSPMVSNSIAALLIHIERTTHRVPHIYFKWTEGNPVANIFRFLFLGEGDAAPLTHEVLRKAVPDLAHRPVVHVS